MINYNQLSNINVNSDEGKLLMATIAILTSMEEKHLLSGEWGTSLHPDTCVQQITELANKVYFNEEWKKEQLIKERDNKINKILRNQQ